MPSNQHHVFIGSYSAPDAPGIQSFWFDDTKGGLAPISSIEGVTNPSFLIVHPNQQWLYSVSETMERADGIAGSVFAFRFDEGGKNVLALNHQPSGGDHPCHLRIDATGKWIFVANYSSSSASVYPIRDDGSLGDMTDHVQHQGKGPNPQRQEGPHAHSTILSPDNHFVIIADLGLDQLVIYQFDAKAGKLHPHGYGAAQPGAGPRHLVFHPNGKILYAANELANTVSVYDYHAAMGALHEIQSLDTLAPDAPENTVADIHLSANADRLYVSNRGDDSIAVYQVEPDGELARLAIAACGGKTPRNFALAPNGNFLLAANQDSNQISILPLRQGNQEPGAPVGQFAMPKPSCIQFV